VRVRYAGENGNRRSACGTAVLVLLIYVPFCVLSSALSSAEGDERAEVSGVPVPLVVVVCVGAKN